MDRVLKHTGRVAVKPGYEALAAVLDAALEQAQSGKGVERHACGEAFERQVICEVGRRVGVGYPLGQATKKTYESERLSAPAAVKELLGAINYLAAGAILRAEREGLSVTDLMGNGAQINSGERGGASCGSPAQD